MRRVVLPTRKVVFLRLVMTLLLVFLILVLWHWSPEGAPPVPSDVDTAVPFRVASTPTPSSTLAVIPVSTRASTS
ncbi:hypothetical protein V6N13_090918 [Hibiscus sabdariffa]